MTVCSCDFHKQNDAKWQLSLVSAKIVSQGLRVRRGSAEFALMFGMTNRVCQLSTLLDNLSVREGEVNCVDPWLRPIMVNVLEVEDMDEFLRCKLYYLSMGPDPRNERKWLVKRDQIYVTIEGRQIGGSITQ